MGASTAEIEALELSLMRAWMGGDTKAIKKLVARNAMMMIGSMPPQLLDRPSFVTAAERGFTCTKFVFREVYARVYGKTAWFVAGAELELAFGSKVWSGSFLVTDLWRKGAMSGWQLAERTLARLDSDDSIGPSVAKLQLWKSS